MRTKFGALKIESVMRAMSEYREIGETAFLAKYANGRGAKTTWISFEGELFPAKALYAAAHDPIILPSAFNTSEAYVFSGGLGLELVTIDKDGIVKTSRSAIDDLDELSGPELPTTQAYVGARYVRNGRIRAEVLKRANGRCEHCGEIGFPTRNGTPYLETHHIISLALQGPDATTNVIALCSTDHRRAHFGVNAHILEDSFKEKLKAIAG
jgi:hypothetical protein